MQISQNSSYQFLSTSKLYKRLEEEKLNISNANGCKMNSSWKTAVLATFIFSIIAATITFQAVSHDNTIIDHSGDTMTAFKCDDSIGWTNNPGKFCRGLINNGLVTKDNLLLINHTHDKIISGEKKGLEAMLPVLFVPPLCVILFCSIFKGCTSIGNNLNKWKKNRLDSLIISLKCSARIDERTAVPSSFIPKLIEFEVLKNEDYKVLNFSQIKKLKNYDPSLFKELINNDDFADKQNIYWHSLDKMIFLSIDDLSKEIKTNNKIFKNEPKFLELLIKGIPRDNLNSHIKTLLASKMEFTNLEVEHLSTKEKIEIIEICHDKACSLKRAYREFEVRSLVNQGLVKFRLIDHHQNPVIIEVSKGLLCKSSDFFSTLLKGNFKESALIKADDPIDLPTVHPDVFKSVISYLKTGNIEENIDLIDLLKFADLYGFMNLIHDAAKHLCNQIDFDDYSSLPSTLQTASDLNLNEFIKKVDLILSDKIMEEDHLTDFFSNEFLITLQMINQFSLQNSLSQLKEKISKKTDDLFTKKKIIRHIVTMMNTDHALIGDLFELSHLFFQKEPTLLKTMWKEALKQQNLEIQSAIISFCNKIENIQISLANWPVPPKHETEFYEDEEKNTFRLKNLNQKEII